MGVLTYMSIVTILFQLAKDERLYELQSLFTGDETVRTMIVAPDILAAVSPPFPDDEEGRRLGEFRAWLDSFVEGCELSVAEDPDRKASDAMLARVHPVADEFWSIRVTEPEDTPGIRAFGAFGSKDMFIALTWERRELIGGRFNEAVDELRASWRDCFRSERPFRGDRLDEYLTNFRAV
jgi:hypothetical protein